MAHISEEHEGPVVVTRATPDRMALSERFGGWDVPASLIGVLVALAMELILVAVLAAFAGTSLNLENVTSDLAIGTLVAAVAVMFVAYFVGGWAAARIARYDGVLNGIMTAVLGLLLAALFAGLGAWAGSEYNVMSAVGAPSWLFDAFDNFGTEALVAGIAALLAMVGGGALGGMLGERYHRSVDSTIVNDRQGSMVPRRRISTRRDDA